MLLTGKLGRYTLLLMNEFRKFPEIWVFHKPNRDTARELLRVRLSRSRRTWRRRRRGGGSEM